MKFLLAAQRGNLEEMKKLKAEGVSVNVANERGHTALMTAVRLNSAGVVNTVFTPRGYEKKSEAEVVQWLLENGADPYSVDAAGYGAIHHAVKNGRSEAVKILVTAAPNLVSSAVETWQPLHFAVAHNKYEIAEFLISRGADAKAKVRDGNKEFSLSDLTRHIPSATDREKMQTLIRSQQTSFSLRNASAEPLQRSSLVAEI